MKPLFSKDEVKYLQDKHRGGLNNQKGNQYESFYTVTQIASLLCEYEDDLDNVSLQAQVPMTFVDDLLINYPDKKVYHQIKDVKNLSWNSGRKYKLSDDFKGQVRLCKHRGENFGLKLVHSHADDNLAPKPMGTRKYTTIELFPACKTMNSLVLSNNRFEKDLRKLLYNGDNLTLDAVSDLASRILGYWGSINNTLPVSLKSIDDKLSEPNAGYRSNVTTTLDPECRTILNRLFGSNYIVSGDMLCMKYNYTTMTILLNDDIQQRIIDTNPSNPWDLFNL